MLAACELFAGIPDDQPRALPDGSLGDVADVQVDRTLPEDSADARPDRVADPDAGDGDAADAKREDICPPFKHVNVTCPGNDPAELCRDRQRCGDCSIRCAEGHACWRGRCVDPEWAYWDVDAAIPDAGRFEVVGEEVRDHKTGLIWQRSVGPRVHFHDTPATGCGFDDAGVSWRMPTLIELLSIIDYAHYAPAIEADPFRYINPTDGGESWLFTSTRNPERLVPDSGAIHAFLMVDMVSGVALSGYGPYHERCVR